MKNRNPRVFIGYSNTSGYYSRLAQGLNELGIKAVFVDLGGNKFDYKREQSEYKIVRICEKLNSKWRQLLDDEKPIYRLWQAVFLLMVPILFIWSLFNFDIYISGGSKSFLLCDIDFVILRLLKKRTIKVSLGAYTRPYYTDASMLCGTYTGKKPTIDEVIRNTEKQKKKIKFIENNVDIFIDHVFQANFHEKEFVALHYLCIPIDDMKHIKPEKELTQVRDKYVRILHAASYAGHKGSAEIKRLVNEVADELAQDGYEIDYIELTNVPNETVLCEIEKSDFIIAEMYSDNPMATFDAEAAYFEKPSVIGGYSSTELKRYYPIELIPPSEFCHPSQMKQSIKKLIVDVPYRIELGQRAKEFVIAHYTCRHVAERLYKIIQGNIPKEWFINPHSLLYINGYGLSESKLKYIVANMIEVNGIGSLQLSDKPELEGLYLKLAFSDIQEETI